MAGCESNPEHENYCKHCATCHDCLEELPQVFVAVRFANPAYGLRSPDNRWHYMETIVLRGQQKVDKLLDQYRLNGVKSSLGVYESTSDRIEVTKIW